MTPIKEKGFRKTLLAVAVLAPAMTLTACGGSSSSSSSPENKDDGSTIAGLAYDGYLRGATVCIDENLNKQCDEGEPTVQTGAGGVFSLTGLSDGQALLPLALQAKSGEGGTVDEDTGEIVDNDFTYLAPAGTKTVSALSTIIQVKTDSILANGGSRADALKAAKAEVAKDLGVNDTDIDLTNYDPIAIAKANDDRSDLAGRIHIVNQITTRNIVNAVRQAQSLDNDTANDADAFSASVTKVAAKVGQIKELVDTAVRDSGLSAPDIGTEKLDTILESILANAQAQPEPVTSDDISAAKNAADKARNAIFDEIKAETGENLDPTDSSDPTGGTGGTSDGGQGVS